jgi:predicted RNA-binding protein
MCLAKAYLSLKGEKKLLLGEITSLKVEGEMLHLRTLFGEQREIAVAIREVDFQRSTVTLEKLG